MGQKVNPIGLRLGINRTWDSRWYADGDYAKMLHEDLKYRAIYLQEQAWPRPACRASSSSGPPRRRA